MAAAPPSRSPVRRPLRILAKIVVVALLVLVVLGLFAGTIAKSVLNRKFAAMKDYTGHVDHVSVSLWRGRVAIDDAVFKKTSEPSAPPVARVARTEFNLTYAALLRGKLSAEVVLDRAELAISKRVAKEDAPEAARKAAPKVARLQDELRRTLPVELTRLELTNTKVRFVEPGRQPPIDVGLDDLHLVATGLSNRKREDRQQLARVELDAVTTGEGRLHVTISADPMNPQPTFDSQFQLRGLALPAFNPVLVAYANADVSAGTFDFDSEIHAANGHYEGYVKPFFKDLNFKTASDRDKNAAQLLAKKVVSAAAHLLENKDEDKVATKAPFRGDFEKNDVDLWTTVANLLRNAFVQGLREGFEGQRPKT